MDEHNPPILRLTYYIKAAELTQRVATAPILERHALSYAQLAMLLTVSHSPGQSGAALARMHGITAQSAGEVIAALVQRGFMERRPATGHGRILTVHLTRAGSALVTDIEPALDAVDKELGRGLSPAEIATVRRVLIKIVANGGTILNSPTPRHTADCE